MVCRIEVENHTHTQYTQPGKVTKEIEQEILDLRITKRFGCNRIRFRLQRLKEISLSTKTIYNVLKRHGLNILKCRLKNRRKWNRFAMKKNQTRWYRWIYRDHFT